MECWRLRFTVENNKEKHTNLELNKFSDTTTKLQGLRCKSMLFTNNQLYISDSNNQQNFRVFIEYMKSFFASIKVI